VHIYTSRAEVGATVFVFRTILQPHVHLKALSGPSSYSQAALKLRMARDISILHRYHYRRTLEVVKLCRDGAQMKLWIPPLL
jgi:hypothetical protein